MEEDQPLSTVRPTMRQQQLLEFIAAFIAEHGYSPSYREVMKGCNYNSVATAALHIRNLIDRGHLVKRGRSARSLELTKAVVKVEELDGPTAAQEKWLVSTINSKFDQYEKTPTDELRDELYVLVGALKAVGLEDAMRSFIPRLPRDN
ncbi:hypothetical protein IPO96_02135 [Candidatus Saccharibacteria bacterium]|jgi:SOS-response transcriptional repressor LexA|nr:MAG: hypothetical protein IPO96_02135 [Candidatus Saccharibacteria bacterium]